MNDLEKPIATAGTQIQLVTANAYVDFAVIVGNCRICEFRIEERHYQDHRIQDRMLTTSRNHAVVNDSPLKWGACRGNPASSC